MDLYIVRHGESESNTGIRTEDPDLTMTGIRQAELCGERLRSADFDKIYSSPMRRAVRTASVINARQVRPKQIEIIPELVECGSGAFETTAEKLRALNADLIINGTKPRAFGSDGERAAYCLERCVFPDAYGTEPDQASRSGDGEVRENNVKVLIVCHGTFNAHLIGRLVNFPFDKNVVISQHNACINRFQLYTVNDVRRVRFKAFNDVGHLPEELRT